MPDKRDPFFIYHMGYWQNKLSLSAPSPREQIIQTAQQGGVSSFPWSYMPEAREQTDQYFISGITCKECQIKAEKSLAATSLAFQQREEKADLMNVCERLRKTVQKTEMEILLGGAQVVTRSKGHKMIYKQSCVNIILTNSVKSSNESDCPEAVASLSLDLQDLSWATCSSRFALGIGVWLHKRISASAIVWSCKHFTLAVFLSFSNTD